MKKVVMIFGRKWFSKTYGNTYHTFELIFDDHTSYTSKVLYGYGRMFEQNARQYCADNGIVISENCFIESSNVNRRKDL